MTRQDVIDYLENNLEIDKEFEITILEFLLKTKSYFADTFSIDDITLMQSNIRADFPIMMNTSSDQVEGLLKKAHDKIEKLEGATATLRHVNEALEIDIATAENRDQDILEKAIETNETYILNMWPAPHVICTKIGMKMDLNEEEKTLVRKEMAK